MDVHLDYAEEIKGLSLVSHSGSGLQPTKTGTVHYKSANKLIFTRFHPYICWSITLIYLIASVIEKWKHTEFGQQLLTKSDQWFKQIA